MAKSKVNHENSRERNQESLPLTRTELKLNDDLYKLLDAEALAMEKPMNELVVQILAAHFGREDLGYIPRKQMGRPRTKFSEAQPA